MTLSPNFLGLACSNADFMDGVITVVTKEIDDFVKSKGVIVGATIGAVTVVATAVTGGIALAVLSTLLIALLAILPVLALLLLGIAAVLKSVDWNV